MIAIIIILVLLFILKNIKTHFVNTNKIELVISRYNEDLEYLKKKPFNKLPVIIYNKGINDNFYKPPLLKKIVNLENIGMCVHTYLYHIIFEYDNLADVTIFLPGSCTSQHKKELTLNTINKTIETQNTVFYIDPVSSNIRDFTLDKYSVNDKNNRVLNEDDSLVNCEPRPFGNWYDKTFPGIELKYWKPWGIFSVSRKHILNRSKKSYEELIQYVNKNKNDECAHYFERSFVSIFDPINSECFYK